MFNETRPSLPDFKSLCIRNVLTEDVAELIGCALQITMVLKVSRAAQGIMPFYGEINDNGGRSRCHVPSINWSD